MADKTRQTKKRLVSTTAKLEAHKRKSDSIQDHRCEVNRVEAELQQSLKRQKELENEMKRLRHKYVITHHLVGNVVVLDGSLYLICAYNSYTNAHSLLHSPTSSLMHIH